MTRLLRGFLSCLLPSEFRSVVLKDLEEEYGARPRSHASQILRSMPHAVRLRVRRWHLLSMWGDLRHGVRALRRAPWYFAAAAAVIALSSAFGVTAFAVVDGALFRPLPIRDESRVFVASPAFSQLGPEPVTCSASVAELDAWQAALPTALWGAADTTGLASLGTTESVNAARITSQYLDTLGVAPFLGGFVAADFELPPGGIQPALITYGLWQRRFGGDVSVIGQTYRGDRDGIRIVGVLPARFVMPASRPPQVLTPMTLARRDPFSRAYDNQVIVRLPGGMRAGEAADRMQAAAARLASSWPAPRGGAQLSESSRIRLGPADQARVIAIRDALTANVSKLSWVVFAGMLLLLMLACLNVAALAAARARDRWRDLSVRRALGARSFDVLRVSAAEHTLVVATGVLAGTFLSSPLLRATLDRMPSYLLLREAELNPRVLMFAGLVFAGCLVAMAVLSTTATRGRNLQGALADGGGGTARRRSSLLMVQIALATVVAVGSALVVGSLVRVWNEDHGFRTTAGILRMSAPPTATPLEVEDLLARLSGLSGVERIGGTTGSVLQRALADSDFDPPMGNPSAEPGSYGVTAGFFDASGLQLLQGRRPTAAEFRSGALVAVVSLSASQLYWPDGWNEGRTVTSAGRAYRVVGVVHDARYTSWDREPVGEIYRPIASMTQARLRSVVLLLRPGARLTDVAVAASESCPDCRVYSASTVAETLNSTIQGRRFRGWLFAAFGAIALVITGTGTLGLLSMMATRRTRELGIRMALGATRSVLVRQIVLEQTVVVVSGLAGGIVVALFAVRPLESFLYKTKIYEPLNWSVAICAVTVIVLIAVVLPSLRATHVDVVGALRPE